MVLITVAILNVCDVSLFAKTTVLLFGRLQVDDKYEVECQLSVKQ